MTGERVPCPPGSGPDTSEELGTPGCYGVDPRYSGPDKLRAFPEHPQAKKPVQVQALQPKGLLKEFDEGIVRGLPCPREVQRRR
jgi:hypothetical protein